ncbi:MAG: acetylxylan esterase [Clostridia bacterium]|nr:acetylxylan esterase [Clostridia bacterium]
MKDPRFQHEYMMDNAEYKGAYKEGMDFDAWQASAREKLGELLGMDTFEKCDDALEIEWMNEEIDYTELRLSYNTEKNFRAAAHLLIPANIQQKVPVMICLQGHSKGMHISLGRPIYPGDEDSINGGDRDFAVQAIREGYAAFVMEQRGFGECGGDETGPKCHQPSAAAMLLGRTLIGERVWDVSRSIDIMEKYFPQLDMSRIAIMGNSGGGTTTIYAAAMEERIAAAMPSCAFCGFKESIGVQHHCICNYVPGIMRWFDMGDLAGLIAPRPLVIVNGKEDGIFPVDSARKQYAVANSIFEAAGASDKCVHVIGSEGHRFYAALGWPAFNGLTGWKKCHHEHG